MHEDSEEIILPLAQASTSYQIEAVLVLGLAVGVSGAQATGALESGGYRIQA